MSFPGKNPNYSSISVVDEQTQGLFVDPKEKALLGSFIISKIPNINFTGIGSNDLVVNTQKFNLAGGVSYTITISATGVGSILDGTFTGPGFQVNEIVQGDISGQTATVIAYNGAFDSTKIYIDFASGPFSPGETITGLTTGTSGILNNEFFGFDLYDWSDSDTNSGSGLVCGTPNELSFKNVVYFLSYNTHNNGDTFQFDVTGQVTEMLNLNGNSTSVLIGNSEVGPSVEVNLLNDIAKVTAIKTILASQNNSFVIGLDDFTVADLSNVTIIPNFFPVQYTVTIDSEGSPDTFSWSDDKGNSASNIAIVANSVLPLSYDVGITFSSDTGHTNGSTWLFQINQGSLTLFGADYNTMQVGIGDLEALGSGANISVDTINNQALVNCPIAVNGSVKTNSYADINGDIVIDAASRIVYGGGNVGVIDLNSGTYNDSGGQIALLAPSGNTRQLISANGSVQLEVQNSQINVLNQLRAVNSFENVRTFKRVSQVRTTSATLNSSSDQSIQYINASGGSITITLPTASVNNRYHIYNFKRVDNSGNIVTIQAAGGQFIDGLASFTLSSNDSREIQCEDIGGYGWFVIGGYKA